MSTIQVSLPFLGGLGNGIVELTNLSDQFYAVVSVSPVIVDIQEYPTGPRSQFIPTIAWQQIDYTPFPIYDTGVVAPPQMPMEPVPVPVVTPEPYGLWWVVVLMLAIAYWSRWRTRRRLLGTKARVRFQRNEH